MFKRFHIDLLNQIDSKRKLKKSRGRPESTSQGRPLNFRLGRPQDVRPQYPQDSQIGSLGEVLGMLDGDVRRMA